VRASRAILEEKDMFLNRGRGSRNASQVLLKPSVARKAISRLWRAQAVRDKLIAEVVNRYGYRAFPIMG
jgi:hypothetical protein